MNSLMRISPILTGLRFVINMNTSQVTMGVEIDAGRLDTVAIPGRDETPLSVNPNGVETGQIPAQLLKMVPRRDA